MLPFTMSSPYSPLIADFPQENRRGDSKKMVCFLGGDSLQKVKNRRPDRSPSVFETKYKC